MDKEHALKSVKEWVSEFIIPNNICPFAHKENKNNTTRYIVKPHITLEDTLFNIINELTQLDSNLEINSTLLIFNQGVDDFNAFLDLLSFANDLLVEQNYEGIYQLASLHPKYQFEGTKQEAAENFSNRAPYPVIHILRESSVNDAVKRYKNPENIYLNNIDRLNNIGYDALKKQFLTWKRK